jgi:hypothetical protein
LEVIKHLLNEPSVALALKCSVEFDNLSLDGEQVTLQFGNEAENGVDNLTHIAELVNCRKHQRVRPVNIAPDLAAAPQS